MLCTDEIWDNVAVRPTTGRKIDGLAVWPGGGRIERRREELGVAHIIGGVAESEQERWFAGNVCRETGDCKRR